MSARFTSARFVGRERELARLAEALEGGRAGRSSTLLISGSGGLGASRLLDEAERRIAALPEPLAVVRCRSRPGRSGDPYAPVVAGLERLVGGLADRELARVAGTGAEELAKLLPGSGARLDGLGLLPARPTVTEPERRQTRMLESILGLLLRIGERDPGRARRSRTSSRPMPGPARSRRSSPGSRGPGGCASWPPTSPTS